jgi:2,4-dienoyl-CoA reductase-like NADH-dependent reductase (Old Yellow Enzyme family)
MQAGFDSVELHCATGYLVSPFICAYINLRDDEDSGSLQNRLRLSNGPDAFAQTM